ncbi:MULTISPECIES: Rieske 2Fe-2S domain-containing protein [unclassified Streptomyces]|uniref:QcrA and Rieske domain-containing protein n=1 Tax=unclassified Streptomyces TaxID=2593676 RepID=UPI0033EC44D4
MTQGSTRRTVLATSAAALVAAGCGKTGSSNSEASPASEATSPPKTASPTGASPTSMTSHPAATSPATEGTAAGRELASTADIPVGGGKVFAQQKVVVTQPEKGEFKAFSAICTHQGCTVNRVANGTIDCPCHGSRFHVTDGSVAHGPAVRPLPVKQIKVEGNSVHLL